MAYCLYPIPTLIHRHSLSFQRAACRYQVAVLKYEMRGWNIQAAPCFLPRSNFHIGLNRSVDDDITRRIRLDTEGVEQNLPLSSASHPLCRDPITIAAFRLGRDPKLPFFFYVTTFIFKHPLLRYQYSHIPSYRWVRVERFLGEKMLEIGPALESLSDHQRQDNWVW
jgi:hypothetical protein